MFSGAEVLQLINDLVKVNRAKTEVLAARSDRLRNVLGLGCRQHENDVPWRFLQSLEERIEGSIGDLMRLVEDVNLESIPCRTVACGFAQFANLIDTTVGRGVDLDYVHGIARADLRARIADAARLGHRLLRRAAVQRRPSGYCHGS